MTCEAKIFYDLYHYDHPEDLKDAVLVSVNPYYEGIPEFALNTYSIRLPFADGSLLAAKIVNGEIVSVDWQP